MSSAAQSLIRTGVNPHSAFSHFAYGAVVVSSDVDDPDGELTLRYLGLAQRAAQLREQKTREQTPPRLQADNQPIFVSVPRTRLGSLFDVLTPDDTAFRRDLIRVGTEEKPSAKALRARDRDIAEHTHLKRLDEDGDGCDAGRAIKGHIRRDKDKGSALDRLAEQFWLSGPSANSTPVQEVRTAGFSARPATTPEQLRRYMHDYRELQQSLRHG